VTDHETVDDILNRASRLTLDELVELGLATDRVAGKLRFRRQWLAAMRGSTAAAAAAGRDAALRVAADGATDAIFAALRRLADSPDSTARLQAALDDWKRAVESGDERQRRNSFRRLQRALGRTFGWRMKPRIGSAVSGTASAVTAALTWDLAHPSSRYTPTARDELIGPWRAAVSD
jgi:hypothetical protein